MDKKYDVVIIGGGPAGLSAAIYTARDLRSTLVIEANLTGGMMALTAKVDNYPGFKAGSTGFEIAKNMTDQAKESGAKISYGKVTNLEQNEDVFKVVIDDSTEVQARAVLIATGTTYRKLGVPGEAEMIGSGVHFCATCDGAFYKDRPIAVIGGGNSAVEEAMFLAKFASKIDLITVGKLTASEVLKQELQEFIDKGKVVVHTNANVKQILHQDGQVTGVEFAQNDIVQQIAVDGVFIFIGLIPQVGFETNFELSTDQAGFVRADDNRTEVKGLFIAGDITADANRQIAVAVGDGVKAALKISKFLASAE